MRRNPHNELRPHAPSHPRVPHGVGGCVEDGSMLSKVEVQHCLPTRRDPSKGDMSDQRIHKLRAGLRIGSGARACSYYAQRRRECAEAHHRLAY
jgi:hypothetical protein